MRDVIIVGAGMSALIAAITLSKENNVKVFSKGSTKEGNSWRAQGGMAAAIHEQDSPVCHLEDTLEAGCYHNDPKMVSILVSEGVPRVKKWITNGMSFDKKANGELSLGMEGAHRTRRILHAGGDRTGSMWMQFLHQQIKLSPNIQVFKNESVIDMVVDHGKCLGVFVKADNGKVVEHFSSATILATGGCGGLYEATSNDPGIIGDGLAMAYRAGATMSDMEFLQFHPTLMKHMGRIIGLASEALRGEGARLIDSDGNEIMEGVHPLKELAPRDVVAREIERKTKEGIQIYLDISSIKSFKSRFPAIHKMCVNGGIQLENKRIPVTAGAHFLMGGIMTDSVGRTSMDGLYAIGEVARTGVHGANRLASNSLLEALVFGERTGEYISTEILENSGHKGQGSLALSSSMEPILPSREEIQKRVSYSLGVERDQRTLEKFITWLKDCGVEYVTTANRTNWSMETIEKSNMLITASLIANAAIQRKESRGGHYRIDYPLQNKEYSCGKQIIQQRTSIKNRESMKL